MDNLIDEAFTTLVTKMEEQLDFDPFDFNTFLKVEDGAPIEKWRKYGEQLYEKGGDDLIQKLCERLMEYAQFVSTMDQNRYRKVRSDLRELEHCWDGIGNLRA